MSRSPVGTRRAWRRREALRLRVSGQYGPEWWEVLPAVAAVLVAVGLSAAVLGWLWAWAGWWAAALAAGALAYGLVAGLRRRRALLADRRRRATCYSLDQVDAADDRGFRTIVGRLLLRDGWTRVRGVRVNDAGVVHLVGVGPDGRQLGVAFERGVERAGRPQEGRAALRPVGGAPQLPDGSHGGPRALFLVVSSGAFARDRVAWAARHGVRLVDRAILQRWAAGEDLAVLLDLDRDDVRTNAS